MEDYVLQVAYGSFNTECIERLYCCVQRSVIGVFVKTGVFVNIDVDS